MAVRTPPTSEDDWAVPRAWWSKSDPFRGLGPTRKTTVNAAAAAAVADTLARSADKIRSALRHPRSHNQFRQRGLAYLSAPGADPIGAAVYAAVGIDAYTLNPDGIGRYFDDNTDLADYLVHTHGFELATSITATLAGIHCEFDSLVPNEWYPNSNSVNYWVATGLTDPPVTVIRRLRALLAAANESWRDCTTAALLAAARRLPARALRVLAARVDQPGNEGAFLDHARGHRDLAAAIRHELPARAQQLLTEAIPDLAACSTPDDASTPGSPTMPR
ncbi:hypothetical protein [Nocardia sp. NBC_01009]|uniref:hypothetical protein n=1 Tax=Nocardia sp. NBC_01009 TaxID=2975996 RepID=UPI00386CC9A2|nr:hypothetical protein OHA42_30915 [Nocardia sp. NBC_01009]